MHGQRSRSPPRPGAGAERARDELIRVGWTKRKAMAVVRMYRKWGYDDLSKRIQRESRNGWLSWQEALLMAELPQEAPPLVGWMGPVA